MKVEREIVKNVHEDEVIANTLLDLESSGIQVDENILKPKEPDVTAFDAESDNIVTEQTDLGNSQVQLSAANKSPIKDLLLDTSSVFQQPLQEQISSVSVEEHTETTITSEVVMPESHAISDIVENVGLKESGASSSCGNQIVDEKMDVDSEVITSSVGPQQNATMGDELVMVDMMSDVGVVEEVLESEEKTESAESMQIEPESDMGLEKE